MEGESDSSTGTPGEPHPAEAEFKGKSPPYDGPKGKHEKSEHAIPHFKLAATAATSLSLTGQEEEPTSKPPSSPSSNVKKFAEDDDGGGGSTFGLKSDYFDDLGVISTLSSPLYDLIFDNKWDEASRRCQTSPQDARWKDRSGELPIHRACWNKVAPLSLIRQIHEAYGEGIKTTATDGRLPLHIACCGASLEVITYLVEMYGDGVKTKDNYGCLPLHLACCVASLEVITYLVEAYGEGVKTTNDDGWLPLHYACSSYPGASLEVIEYLHGLHSDGATTKDKNGHTSVDLLKDNCRLSEEDKAKARNILSNPPRPRTLPPHPLTTTTASAATPATTSSTDASNTTTTRSTSTSTQPSMSPPEGDRSRTVSHRGDDAYAFDNHECTTATATATVAVAGATWLAEQAEAEAVSEEEASSLYPGEQSSMEVASKVRPPDVHVSSEPASQPITLLPSVVTTVSLSGQSEERKSKRLPPLVPPVAHLPHIAQPTKAKLWDLIDDRKWDEASNRCQDHPEEARWNDPWFGLPIHRACRRGAPLDIVRCLHEAYGEGVRTTDNSGQLPLHLECMYRSFDEDVEVIRYVKGLPPKGLEVIRYLHGLHPDGATEEDIGGETPMDCLEGNSNLSLEDKAAARAILSSPPSSHTPPLRPTIPVPASTTRKLNAHSRELFFNPAAKSSMPSARPPPPAESAAAATPPLQPPPAGSAPAPVMASAAPLGACATAVPTLSPWAAHGHSPVFQQKGGQQGQAQQQQRQGQPGGGGGGSEGGGLEDPSFFDLRLGGGQWQPLQQLQVMGDPPPGQPYMTAGGFYTAAPAPAPAHAQHHQQQGAQASHRHPFMMHHPQIGQGGPQMPVTPAPGNLDTYRGTPMGAVGLPPQMTPPQSFCPPCSADVVAAMHHGQMSDGPPYAELGNVLSDRPLDHHDSSKPSPQHVTLQYSAARMSSSGQTEEPTFKPSSSPTSKVNNFAEDDDGGSVSKQSSPRPTEVLWDMVRARNWDDASRRCRDQPQDTRWKQCGELPIHKACYWGAPLSLVRCLHEAYVEGVRITDNFGQLPLHVACWNGASLEIIRYLHDKYPAGATQKDNDGDTPADLLKQQHFFSEEDYAVARGILCNLPPAHEPPSPPTKHTLTGTATAATTTSADISNITTETASTSETATRTTSAWPLMAPPRDVPGGMVSCGGDDAHAFGGYMCERAHASLPTLAEATVEAAAGLADEDGVAAADDASGRGNGQVEAVTCNAGGVHVAAERETLRVETGAASSQYAERARHGAEVAPEAKRHMAERVRGEAGSVSQNAKRLRSDTEFAREAGEDDASAQAVGGRGRHSVQSFDNTNRSECVDTSAPDEASFRLSAARLEANGYYELRRPAQNDEGSVPTTGTRFLSNESPSRHGHSWEIHCLYDTLLVPESEHETVCDLKNVGYIALAHKDGEETDSSEGETGNDGGRNNDGGDAGGSTWSRRVNSTIRSLGIGGEKQDEEKLLVTRYNYPYKGRGSATIFVRNERTDHSGKDVIEIIDIDLRTAAVTDLKSEIRFIWHRDATDQDLCLFRENGDELCTDAKSLTDCSIEEGDTILLRQPRVEGQLDVDQQDELDDWKAKTSSGRSDPLQLHELRCKGQSLFDASCADNFRPGLRIRFLPFYTPVVSNSTQALLEVKVCTLSFGVDKRGSNVFAMKDISTRRGFFVDKVRLSLTLPGSIEPTRMSSPKYTIAQNTYCSKRMSGVALTESIGIDPFLDVDGRQGRATLMAIPRTPVHWWIRGEETPQAWDLNRQTWNAPEGGGYTLYDVMDPRDIRDFKSHAYSGHNAWLERRVIPEVTTSFAPQIRKDDHFMTASWALKKSQDPFHDPENEHITISDRQARATFKVELLMGLCEIEIVTLPGRIIQSYEVVKRYREVSINQMVQFVRFPPAPTIFSSPKTVTAVNDFKSPSSFLSERKSIRNLILRRNWDVVWTTLCGEDFDFHDIDRRDNNGESLLHLVCKGGPPIRVVERLVCLCPACLKATNEDGELPLHTACFSGAPCDVIKYLIERHPSSVSLRRHSDGKTPLEVAQTHLWIFCEEQQANALHLLRKRGFPEVFRDEKETGLPTKSAYEKWAHLPPPGLTDANAIVLFIDISGFKAVNTIVGQQAGDEAIGRYAEKIESLCQKACQGAEQNKIRIIMDIFRVGGDEFVVVGKFVGKIERVWEKVFKNLVAMLADLSEKDHMNPPRFFTFLRVGCAAGRVSINGMRLLFTRAEEKQKDLGNMIDRHRKGKVSLAQIRKGGIPNTSELVIITKDSKVLDDSGAPDIVFPCFNPQGGYSKQF